MTGAEATGHADRHGAAVLRDAARRLTVSNVTDAGEEPVPDANAEKIKARLREIAGELDPRGW